VIITQSGDQFKSLTRSFKPGMIVMDLQMPETDGIELLRFLADEKCSADLLLVSGMDTKVRSAAVHLGESLNLSMLGTLQKPLLLEDLEAMLKKSMAKTGVISHDILKAAIAGRQLCVHYQPKISFGEDRHYRVKGFEALVRWDHPDKGMLMPDEFITLAEESGLIGPLTEFVLEESLRQVNRWCEQVDFRPEISVNLAPHLLADATLPDRIIALLGRAKVDGSQLMLEITETGIMEDVPSNVAALTRLRVKGVNISIDDFGTGYSSLVQIYRMPFNELKIDKSFVMELDQSQEAKTIVRAIVELAHNLNLTVCAEGIETGSTFRYLRELGCDFGQGYFISRPIPPDQVLDWVAHWQDRMPLSLDPA